MMNARNPIRAGLTIFGVILASLVLWTAPALGLVTDFKGQIGAGTIQGRGSVAPNASTGEIYYAEIRGTNSGSNTLDRFSSTGALLGEAPDSGGGLAVDNSTGPYAGDIYNTGPRYVERLTPSGTPVDFTKAEPYVSGDRITGTPSGAFVTRGYPLADTVDSKGNVYVWEYNGQSLEENGSVYVFNDEGEFLYAITPPFPSETNAEAIKAVAVAADGAIYISGEGFLYPEGAHSTRFVDRFNEKGEYEGAGLDLASAPGSLEHGVAQGQTVFGGEYGGLAVSNVTGDIYVDVEISSYSPTYVIDVFDAEGKYQEDIAEAPVGGVFTEGPDISVSPSGYLYFVTGEEGHKPVIDVFTPTFVTIPDVTTGAAPSMIGHVSAVVSGTVSPDGFEATCSVEYGLGGTLTSSVPCLPPTIGADQGVTTVEGKLSGLLPRSTSYEYRVCALNFNDITNCGVRRSFATLPDKPAVLEESVGFVTPTEVLLNGAVNPETGATTYHFAYGPSAGYGLQGPTEDRAVGSGEAPLPVEGISIGGLRPGTTYHYALVATNAAGTTYGPDQTFTTAPAPVPSASTGAATGISQNGVTLTGTVDPDGVQTSYEFDLGTDTAYGTRVFASAESGTEPVNVSAVFASLAPATTYHYRLVASNEFGTSYGADQTFTTPGFPTSLLGYPATLELVATPPIVFPAAVAAAPKPAPPVGHRKRAAAHRGKRKQAKGKKDKGKGKGRKSSVGARRGDRGRSGK